MRCLDGLYGPGAGEAFSRCCYLTRVIPGAEAAISESPGVGAVAVRITWTDGPALVGSCAIEFTAKRAHYTDLALTDGTDGYQRRGVYRELIIKQPTWYATVGIETLTAWPLNDEAEAALALGGFHWQTVDGRELFAARVDVPDRMAEYRRWVLDGEPPKGEPAWRRVLVAHAGRS